MFRLQRTVLGKSKLLLRLSCLLSFHTRSMSFINYMGNGLFNIIIYLYTIIMYAASRYSKLNAVYSLQPQQSYIMGPCELMKMWM